MEEFKFTPVLCSLWYGGLNGLYGFFCFFLFARLRISAVFIRGIGVVRLLRTFDRDAI